MNRQLFSSAESSETQLLSQPGMVAVSQRVPESLPQSIKTDAPSLTFYHRQILKIKNEIFPHDYLYTRIIRAKQFIDKFYFKNIDLNAIADEAYFSKFHFIRLFKMVYGQTPHQYLICVRIEKTKLLLRSTVAVSAICFTVGFDSVTSFTRLFKKMTGSTPSSFQNNSKKAKPAFTPIPLKYLP